MEEAARADIDSLYEQLRRDPRMLEEIDELPFIHSPVHVAAETGKPDLVLEIIRLKPSLGSKLNTDGLSPLHLALRDPDHTSTVRRVIKFYPNLIGVAGKEGLTPLHKVAESGNIELLAEFLLACPASIKKLTIRHETAVHIAARNQRVDALKVLIGWLDRTNNLEVLNWKDYEGNTALNLAASTNNLQIPRQEMEQILKGAGATTASSDPPDTLLAEFLGRRPSKFCKWRRGYATYLDVGLPGEMRNALLVVAVLIATATYQVVLQPPGGVSQGKTTSLILKGTITNTTSIDTIDYGSPVGEDAGKVVIPEKEFYSFMFQNTVAFCASIAIIFQLIPRNHYNILLYISLIFMIHSYIYSGFAIAPRPWILVIACVPAFAMLMIFLLLTTHQGFKFMSRRRATDYAIQDMTRSVYLCRYPEERGH